MPEYIINPENITMKQKAALEMLNLSSAQSANDYYLKDIDYVFINPDDQLEYKLIFTHDTHIINPSEMSEEQEVILGEYLLSEKKRAAEQAKAQPDDSQIADNTCKTRHIPPPGTSGGSNVTQLAPPVARNDWLKYTPYIDSSCENRSICLTQTLYIRGRSLKRKDVEHEFDDVRYEVYSADKNAILGSGSCTSVSRLIATLVPQSDARVKSKLKAEGKKRAVKPIPYNSQDMRTRKIIKRKAIQENSLSIQAGQLHTKPLCIGENTFYLTSRVARGQSLKKILNKALTHQQRYQLSIALIEALTYLHSLGIRHQDIKPDNIIVDMSTSTYIVTFVDFGAADTINSTTKNLGTPLYQAPEILKSIGDSENYPLSTKIDVFSLGRILSQIWGNRNFGLYYQVVGNSNDHFSNFDEEHLALELQADPSLIVSLEDILLGMTKFKPDQRSSLECAKVKMMALGPLIEELSDTATLYTLSTLSGGINEEPINNNYSNGVVYSSGDFDF